ncbi:MAG: hypothetical protein QOF23_1207 [Solirubrobacterales bacterium]|jgi:hypothetical protein|nr:hypothetical protein [Solirubrobacterales bacterium]MEA3036110.1 hypothetical protein [Sphingomonadales bacterium]
MRTLRKRHPSPAMVVAIIALVVALAGTAYAAQTINGGAIKKQTIGGGKLKQKTLTGFQINTNKLGVVPAAVRATHTYWAVVNNPGSPGNATLARASDAGIAATEGGGAVTVTFPVNITGCANVAGRDNAGTSVPNSGYAQTNTSAANPNAIEVHTRDKEGKNEDADFHLIVVCP